jgi:hypothetical protein
MQPKNTPSLGDLPPELLLEINEHLSEADRNALARTNREIYGWINHILYCDNIRHNNASALRWAVINNVESTVRMCLKRGATIDPPPLRRKRKKSTGSTAVINVTRARLNPTTCRLSV